MSSTDERTTLERIVSWSDPAQAFAFVLQTWGSSPRPIGSLLAIGATGVFEGSVSGGCVENAVIDEAAEVIKSGVPKRLSYGVSDESAWEVGLPCGGTIEILLLRTTGSEFSQVLLDATPVTLVARTDTGEIGLCTESFWSGALPAHETLREISLQLLKSGESRLETIGQYEYFLRPFTRPWRLVVVGAAHIAQPLTTMATDAGFDITIIDPRRGYATETRFPAIALVHEWPDTALPDLSLDARSAVIALSHDPKIDDPALTAALDSPAFYIGALGSQRNHKKRLERLVGGGYGAAELARIRGPVGLNIGGNHPSEIAVSILAEIIAVKNGKPLGDTSN